MNTGLLIIDIQNDYFPGGAFEVPGAMAASENAKKLLEYSRKQGLPVFHVQHIFVQPGAVFFLPDTSGAEIHSNVTPLENETVIQKHSPNSFKGTNLEESLQAQGVKKLIICGMMTQMCIDATTRAAFDTGYENVVVHDACAAKEQSFENQEISSEQVQGSFMAALGAVFAKIESTKSVVREAVHAN